MNRELVIKYEVFEETGKTVMSVVDTERNEILNMFEGKMAERVYRILSGKRANTLAPVDNREDTAIKVEMQKISENIISKMYLSIEDESLTKAAIKRLYDEIRELLKQLEKLALEMCNCEGHV